MRLAVLVVPAVLLGLSAQASPAQAANPVLIGKIQYDSPGSDTRTAASLNAEYVTIKNVTRVARSLKGWTLRDAQNHVYSFPAFTLGAGRSVIVHTGTGTNNASNLYWRSGNYVWNNAGDTATLKNAAGTTQDTCRWTTTAPGYTAC
jgi:hypothetical protein